MKIEEVLQNQRLNEWGQMVQACRSSGKSVSAWCSENDINEKTYYYRQRKVCSALPANRETRPVESQIAFAEVPTVWNGAASKSAITVRMRSADRYSQWSGPPDGGDCISAPGVLMLNDFTQAEHIYVACGYTDLRKGIDGFALLVKEEFSLDPFSRSLFLFCGKRNDRIKALYWEGDGFVLLYKRLERGSFQWPRSKDAMRTLTERQYRWLMEGLNIEQPRAIRDADPVLLA